MWVSILVTKIKPLLLPNFDWKEGAKNSASSWFLNLKFPLASRTVGIFSTNEFTLSRISGAFNALFWYILRNKRNKIRIWENPKSRFKTSRDYFHTPRWFQILPRKKVDNLLTDWKCSQVGNDEEILFCNSQIFKTERRSGPLRFAPNWIFTGQKLRFETSRCRSIYGDQAKTAGSKRLLLAQICRLDINLKKATAAFKKFKQIIKNFAQIFSEMKRLVNICARVKFADKLFRANWKKWVSLCVISISKMPERNLAKSAKRSFALRYFEFSFLTRKFASRFNSYSDQFNLT